MGRRRGCVWPVGRARGVVWRCWKKCGGQKQAGGVQDGAWRGGRRRKSSELELCMCVRVCWFRPRVCAGATWVEKAFVVGYGLVRPECVHVYV